MTAPVPAIGDVITAAEDLAALPQGSVVVDDRGAARTKRYGNSHMGYGWTFAGNGPLTDEELADGHPMLVIHVGHHVPDVLAALKQTATSEGNTP